MNELFKHEEKGRCSGAYFFFDGRSGQNDLSMHEKMLRSLISQVADQTIGIPEALDRIYGNGHQKPSRVDLEDTFKSIIESFEHSWIIIDALDECVDRKALLDWLERLANWSGGKLHLMTSSRAEPDIEHRLSKVDCLSRVEYGNDIGNADIRAYITTQLSERDDLDEEMCGIVMSALVSGAGGM